MKGRAPLWAPWRMEYILADKTKAACVFCAHARGAHGSSAKRRKNHVLAATERAFVCLNKYPFASGHLLVVPTRHVADLADLESAEYAELMLVARASLSALRAAVKPQGINLGVNLGPAAGAGIADHVHMHIVPRWGGDTNFMPVVAEVRVMPQHLDETYDVLAPHFAKITAPREAGEAREKKNRRSTR